MNETNTFITTVKVFSHRAISGSVYTAGLAATLLAMSPHGVLAQDLEPRQYSNIPIGANFLVAGYARSVGSVLFDPAIDLENASVDFDGPVIGYARGIGVAGMSGKIDGGLARVCLSGSADYQGERVGRNVCGFGDARMRFSVNLLGAPAYSLDEFATYRQDLVVGASVSVNAPTGQYDADRLVNIGTNRWATKLEIGLSKVVRQWLIEFALAGTFYQKDDDFYGGIGLEQDPIAALQAHFVRPLRSGIWLAVDTTMYAGGSTTTGGEPDRNRQSNTRLGFTLSLPINARQSVRLHASSGVSTRTGSDFDTAAFSWQYRWGDPRPR